MVVSLEPLAIMEPLGDQTTEFTEPVWPVTAIEVGKFNCQVLIVTMLGDVAAPEFELANSQAGYTLLKNKTLYWDKPRGTPPRDPVLMLRSFLADSIQRFQTAPEPSLKIPQQYFV